MEIERTKSFYEHLDSRDLCDCAYCQNYINEIKAAYPQVADYLHSFGIDIEKPFETMPLEPEATGYIEYISAQYIVCGEPNDFIKTVIDSVTVDITDTHPPTQLDEPHFVVEIHPVRLKWAVREKPLRGRKKFRKIVIGGRP